MLRKPTSATVVALFLLLQAHLIHAGTLVGHVRDQNWYARPNPTAPLGVGYYEYAVNGNAQNLSNLGAFTATDVFGAFTNHNLSAGNYTVASWDVWWRSAYVFNVPVPASGTTVDIDVRLHATMWGYPAFWDETGYHEFGQTFVATGPISMFYLRDPLGSNFVRTVTVHQNSPAGAQIGATRSYGSGGDQRLVYGYNQMPTVPGQTYYVRIRTPSPSRGGVLMQMDPRPDFSDPMPGGWLFLGDGTTLTSYADRDLGLVIMSDDDGLITDLFARSSGAALSGITSAGQTFIARGVNLISAAVWINDAVSTFVVRVRQNGPGGPQVGTTKRARPGRPSGDPELIVTWSPGECPLTPGQIYYLEVTREGGGTLNSVYANSSNPFAYGQAYTNGVAISGTDLAGTLMEEQSAGSAIRPYVRIIEDPLVAENSRGSNQLTVAWLTDVPSDSRLEYAVEYPPYTHSLYSSNFTTNHSLTITSLQPHTLYHYRVQSANTNYKTAISRDFVICTRPASSNLLVNGSFEEGVTVSPTNAIPGWTYSPGSDIKASSGNHFFSLKPHVGNWFVQYSVNGGSSGSYLYQRVPGTQIGREYTFSAWLMTAMRENNTWKYDEWDEQSRLIHMRIGIDPRGGTNGNSSNIQWTPRLYSHRHYTQVAKSAAAQSNSVTVFIQMAGQGGQWHLYGIDDCVLSDEQIPIRFGETTLSNGTFRTLVLGRANRNVLVESSIDFTNWSTAANLPNRAGAVEFRDPFATNRTQRFLRARSP